jgi:cytosine/adenosine deaminase-related metal-dependent hydrolase
MDDAGTEHESGWVLAEDGLVAETGAGPEPEAESREDLDGALVTPGLVNTHHHLYQWATRGYAPDATLFEWLTELYPVWARFDESIVEAAAAAGLAWLALSGCTTSSDHHYLFPRGGGDALGATIAAAGRIGLRFHPTRGSMDLGQSQGGLPPDSVVESLDAILAASQTAVERYHDPSPAAMVRVGLAPCSPFSVTGDLLRESATLARSLGVRLHTHLAETLDEEDFCRTTYGCTPVEYLERLDWIGPDVWLAHGVHLSQAEIERIGATGTGVAHCPSSNGRLGAGTASARALLDAGGPVGLGVDGAASQEAGRLGDELRQALYASRSRYGPRSLSCRQALQMATIGGAACLGRADEIGSLEPGKLADLALWRVDGLGHAGIEDPVAALVLGTQPPLELLTVGGSIVVDRGELLTASTDTLTADLRAASAKVRP